MTKSPEKMTQLLQSAIEIVQKLNPEQQDKIATMMLSIAKGHRPLGLATGLVQVPDNFNDELPPDELSNWYDTNPGDPLA